MGRIKICTTFATLLIVEASCFSKPDKSLQSVLQHKSYKINIIPYFINNRWYVVTEFSFQEDRSSCPLVIQTILIFLVQTFFTTRNIFFFALGLVLLHIDVFTRWILHIKYREKHQKASS